MKRISNEIAAKEYGVLLGHYPLRYYLTKNGFVIDSDGDIRYSPIPINTEEELQKILENIKKEKEN